MRVRVLVGWFLATPRARAPAPHVVGRASVLCVPAWCGLPGVPRGAPTGCARVVPPHGVPKGAPEGCPDADSSVGRARHPTGQAPADRQADAPTAPHATYGPRTRATDPAHLQTHTRTYGPRARTYGPRAREPGRGTSPTGPKTRQPHGRTRQLATTGAAQRARRRTTRNTATQTPKEASTRQTQQGHHQGRRQGNPKGTPPGAHTTQPPTGEAHKGRGHNQAPSHTPPRAGSLLCWFCWLVAWLFVGPLRPRSPPPLPVFLGLVLGMVVVVVKGAPWGG